MFPVSIFFLPFTPSYVIRRWIFKCYDSQRSHYMKYNGENISIVSQQTESFWCTRFSAQRQIQMEHTCSCTCLTQVTRCLENSQARNASIVSMVTAISFACYIFDIPHSVFVIVVFPPWKVTWQGNFAWLPWAPQGNHGGPSCYVMWNSTNNHPTSCLFSPVLSGHHTSFLWTAAGSTADRAAPPHRG